MVTRLIVLSYDIISTLDSYSHMLVTYYWILGEMFRVGGRIVNLIGLLKN